MTFKIGPNAFSEATVSEPVCDRAKEICFGNLASAPAGLPKCGHDLLGGVAIQGMTGLGECLLWFPLRRLSISIAFSVQGGSAPRILGYGHLRGWPSTLRSGRPSLRLACKCNRLALRADAVQEDGSGFVSRIPGNQFASEGSGEDGLNDCGALRGSQLRPLINPLSSLRFR